MKIPGIFSQNYSYTLLNYDHIQELISEGLSEKIIKILSQIEISYPFTFLEKEGIREVIDKLDNFFWIKNRYGFVEVVNQKLAEYFNTSFAQLVENYPQKSINLNQIPFASAILSSSGHINQINTKFQELFSSEHHELENSLINEVFLPKFIRVYEEFIASKDTEITIESSEFLPNQAYPLLFLLGKIFDKKNSIVTVMLAVKSPTTKTIEAERVNNLGMIENLIRNNPDAVLICDKENLKFLEVNEVAINLYGYQREEFLQMDLTDLYSAEDIQLLLDSSSTNIKEGSFH